MEKLVVRTKEGEELTLWKQDCGNWCCPVCGSPELSIPAWNEEGASFEMCGCGVEFGFDDIQGGSRNAVSGVKNNWLRWRQILVKKYRFNPEKLKELRQQIKVIDPEYKL